MKNAMCDFFKLYVILTPPWRGKNLKMMRSFPFTSFRVRMTEKGNSHFTNKKRAQSTLEFTILTIIIIGVFLAASDYVKRGIQGRWKSAVDDLGDQYDPRTANTTLNSTLLSNSEMFISTINATDGGVVTLRNDTAESVEVKQGSVVVGPPEP